MPEAYELVNVAIALTAYAAERPGLIVADTDYHRRVAEHFGPFREHPLVLELDARMRVEPPLSYARVKMNGYAFEFDAQGRLVRSPVYERTGYEEDETNALLPLLGQMQEFADASGFRVFYAANRDLYESQVAFFRDSLDLAGMWRWLEAEFPGVRPYDGVKVVFSPLVGSVQTLTTFESDGYRELQPHVNYPYVVNPNFTPEGAVIWRGTTLFGELNHGFVNPTSERHRAGIEAAIGDRAQWTTPENAVAYPDDLALFNEYMNFGLIVLYHQAFMRREADRSYAHARIDSVMVEGRGFPRFAQFSAFLAELAAERAEGETIADLYPRIIAWFAARSAEADTAARSSEPAP